MPRRRKTSNLAVGVAQRAGVQKTTQARRSFSHPLSYMGYRFPGGKFALMERLRLIADQDPRIRRMVDRWFALSKSDRRYIGLDELAQSLRIDASDLIPALMPVLPPNEAQTLFRATLDWPHAVARTLAIALGNGPAAARARAAYLQHTGIFNVYKRGVEDY